MLYKIKCCILWYIACYITSYVQAGLLDPPDAEAARLFTANVESFFTPTLPHSFGNSQGGVAGSRSGADNGSRLYELNTPI